MTKTGGSRHQKRIAAPRNWVIPRKKYTFTAHASPGPHGKEHCLPLKIILRDILRVAENAREARLILNKRLVKIDGRVVTDPNFPVGLMDIIEIDRINKYYQMLPHQQHVLMPYEISAPDKLTKFCQIKGKTTVKGDILQLNLHDGRNILLPKEEGIEKRHRVKDVIEISLPGQEIVSHLPFKEGMYAIITQGKNVGTHGMLREFEWRYGPRASTVTLEAADGSMVQTTPEYIFIIGEKKPAMTIPEEMQ